MFCKSCQQHKADDAFYSCNRTRCKECVKESVRANRLEKIEHYRAFDKARASMPHRVAARKDYAKTDAGIQARRRANAKYYAEGGGKAAHQRYNSSEHGKEARKSTLLRNRQKYPERHAARVALGNAVRDRRVTPWPVCALPECNQKPAAHHPDYSRPLDVVWLCPTHHKQAHALVANHPSIKERA